jgi:acetyl-CoA carboxylase biotin carboxyl carrier protein
MNIKEIRELIQLIEESAVEEFEMEKAGVRIRVKKTLVSPLKNSIKNLQLSSEDIPKTEIEVLEFPTEETESNQIFKSPIVGTFYVTPKPDAEPFVKIGDPVSKGTVLCVIEAMKIFNQIESDIDGVIVNVLVESGQPVEYGQPLFAIQVAN